MFGIEKVFGRKPEEQAGKESVAGLDVPKNKNEDIVFLNQSVEAKQRWQTKDGNFTVTIVKHLEKTGRFEIVLKDNKKEVSEVFKKSSEELTALLLSGGYELISPKTEAMSEPAVFEAVPETSAIAIDESQSEVPSLWDEYVSLDQEITEINNEKVSEMAAEIAAILEKNADIFGEKYAEYQSVQNAIVESISAVMKETDALSDTVEKPDQQISPEFLETKKMHHKKLLALYVELASLKTLVNIYLEEEEVHSETPSAPPIVTTGEKIDPLPEPAIPVSSNTVVNMGDYRKKAPSKPATKSIDSPFGETSSKKTGTNEDESKVVVAGAEAVLPEKKELSRVRAMERREATERKNTELFEAVSKALKENHVFRKDGEPMLVIRTIAPQEIGMEYKKAVSDTVWHQETIKPGKIENFLDYLKNTFDWTPGKKERKAAKPKSKRERIRQDTAPFDKDDTARASQVETPDHENVRSAERIAAAKTIVAENVDESVQPEAASGIAESKLSVDKERTYEELEKSLPAVKRKQCGSVVSEGLAPLVQQMERNEGATLQSLIDRIGIEKLAQSIAQSIVTILPVGSGWNEEERLVFASEFAKREIIESLK